MGWPAGHRSVGGMRATIYNAMPLEGVRRWSPSCTNSSAGTAEAMAYRILTLNNICARGLERLPRERYEVASDIAAAGRDPACARPTCTA